MEDILDDISSTNSIVYKQRIIEGISEDLKDDFECIVECLSDRQIANVYKTGEMLRTLY